MNDKPKAFVLSWTNPTYGDLSEGRATVILTFPNMDQHQRTLDYVLGETVEIYGYEYEFYADFSGNLKIR